MGWRSVGKWQDGDHDESPESFRLMFACRQNAIDGFVPNNFYWCDGEW